MKFKSALVTQVSGSVGGMTGSRNRSGMYFRSRAMPTNPNTALQQAVRSNFSQASKDWKIDLGNSEREDWETYAANTPMKNTLGDTIYLTGQQMYIRSASFRAQAGLAKKIQGPTTFGLPVINVTGATQATGTATLLVSYTQDEPWQTDDDGGFVCYTSRAVGPTINFFKGPYKFAGTEPGSSTTPPTSPITFTSTSTLDIPQKGFIQIRVSDGEGRLSEAVRVPIVVS